VTVTGIADDARTTAIARRVIAMDRTPLPPPATEETASDAAPSTSGVTP
jgi:hypothetical protein